MERQNGRINQQPIINERKKDVICDKAGKKKNWDGKQMTRLQGAGRKTIIYHRHTSAPMMAAIMSWSATDVNVWGAVPATIKLFEPKSW